MSGIASVSAALAPAESLRPMAARTFFTAVRISLLRAWLRASCVMRWRFFFWDDLMLATSDILLQAKSRGRIMRTTPHNVKHEQVALVSRDRSTPDHPRPDQRSVRPRAAR